MQHFTEWLQRLVETPGVQGKILATVIAIVSLGLLRWLILRIVTRRIDDARVLYHWRKISSLVAFLLGMFLVGRTWFEGFQSISTFLGLLSAGVAIALRDPIVNLAGWLFIIWRRPFQVGDRVQIGAHAGDVIDLRVFQFTILEIGNWVSADQSTGRLIHVPNGKVFTETQANYTKGFKYIWDEIPVLVTFESDWRKAKEILRRIAEQRAEQLSQDAQERLREAARRYLIFYSALTPIVYTSVEDSGVLLTIRYLCEPRARRGSAQAIWEDILQEFAAADDIDFAYPTQRFYNNVREGKPGTKPPGGEP